MYFFILKVKHKKEQTLTPTISYFKRAERIQAASLGDPLVVVQEIGYVLWWQGDPAVVERWCWWFVVWVFRRLSGYHNG